MSREKPLLSVIIPIYNVEPYIKKCLNSLISQTLQDMEFLCIDDGSVDSSVNILERYAAKDSRFKVVHQENQGAAAARNLGLDMACGEWIAFLDSDDFYPNDDTLQVMYDNAIRHDVRICGGSLLSINSRGWVRHRRYTGEIEGYHFKQDGLMSFSDYQFDYGYWRFIYERQFIERNHLRFPMVRLFEDPPFMTQAFALAGEFYALHRPTYAYRDGNGWAHIDWLADDNVKARHMLLGMSEVCCIAEERKLEKLRLRRLRNLFVGAGEVFRRASLLPRIREEYAEVLKAHAPLVTIVVPVYNDEKYVGECLDSILAQTYKHIEVICVNDGSTDDSLSILERYAKRSDAFFNIKVVSQENCGLSAARNAGMKQATGKYIYFLDSDDMLNQADAILEMVLLSEEHQLDQLIFTCKIFTNEKVKGLRKRIREEKRYHSVDKGLKDIVLSGMDLFSRLENADRFYATQQTRFYRLGSLQDHNLRYPDRLLHEDNYMAPVSLRFAERAMIVDHPYLARRIRAGSIVTSTGDKSKRFAGLWGVVQLLCQDKRLWDAPEDFQNMLRKFIRKRISDMYWLVEDSHDETLFAKKMLILSCKGKYA